MAVGKNKKVSKGGKRSKKKIVDPMTRKEWYDVIAPTSFKVRNFTKTIGNKTIGTRLASTGLLGRVFTATLADLNETNTRDDPFRKVKFLVRDIQGRNLLTQFYGMDLSTDRVRSLLRKWCTTIETVVEAKTADGYHLRIFVLAFTKRQPGQLSKNCYAKARLVRWVRTRMTRILQKRLSLVDLHKAVHLLVNENLSDLLQKLCNPILPIRDVKLRKCKVIKSPQLDVAKFVESLGVIPASREGIVAAGADIGQPVEAAVAAA